MDIVKSPKYDGYQHELASVVYNIFDKNAAGTSHTGTGISFETQQLAEKLYEPIITKF